MRAVRIHEHGGPEVLRLDQVAEPEPGPGELLVRQLATSVNHRDIWIRKGLGDATFQVPLPQTLGIDIAGEVVGAGPGVAGIEVGTRVTMNPLIACGECWACRRDEPHRCPRSDIFNGAYADLVAIPAAHAIAISPTVSVEQLGCFANSYVTAWEMLVAKADVSAGDVVFVWAGTGGLGSAGLQIAKLAGANVISTAGSEAKLEALRALGPDLVLDHHRDDVVRAVMEYTDGRGVDIVFEHVGTATWGRSIELVAPWGTIVTAGLTSGAALSMNVVDVIVKQLRIVGSCVATNASAHAAAAQLNAGRLTPLVGATLPLEEIAAGHRMLEEGGVIGKVLISMGEQL